MNPTKNILIAPNPASARFVMKMANLPSDSTEIHVHPINEVLNFGSANPTDALRAITEEGVVPHVTTIFLDQAAKLGRPFHYHQLQPVGTAGSTAVGYSRFAPKPRTLVVLEINDVAAYAKLADTAAFKKAIKPPTSAEAPKAISAAELNDMEVDVDL